MSYPDDMPSEDNLEAELLIAARWEKYVAIETAAGRELWDYDQWLAAGQPVVIKEGTKKPEPFDEDAVDGSSAWPQR